jgi:DNA-directed RNA polymerase specialized sigma24 family protein
VAAAAAGENNPFGFALVRQYLRTTMSELTDQHLLAAWDERRDEAAFRSLLGRYAGFVYGATLRRVGDAGLAEEISQDVFARLAHGTPHARFCPRPHFRVESSALPWMLRAWLA